MYFDIHQRHVKAKGGESAMLLTFSVKNWKSYRDEASFSMLAGRARRNSERIARLPVWKTRALPFAVIYGGNASGKSNLFEALSFSKFFVVSSVGLGRGIPVSPFRLDPEAAATPTDFMFEIFASESIYRFSFSVTSREVVRESLEKAGPKRDCFQLLYEREAGVGIKFGEGEDKDNRLDFVFKGTRANQLFLSNAVSQNVDQFRAVYDWFDENLKIVFPNTYPDIFGEYFKSGSAVNERINRLLAATDTGIDSLGSETMPVPEALKGAGAFLGEGRFLSFDNSGSFLFNKNGNLAACRLVPRHTGAGGASVDFGFGEESDGSQRLVSLLPAFVDLEAHDSQKVYVVDELDRSLHPTLVRGLVEFFLRRCGANTKSQLLVTTHDVLLMDQDILRSDEMWLTERGPDGNTSLIAFDEYKGVSKDRRLLKSYLEGRLGGVPILAF